MFFTDWFFKSVFEKSVLEKKKSVLEKSLEMFRIYGKKISIFCLAGKIEELNNEITKNTKCAPTTIFGEY